MLPEWRGIENTGRRKKSQLNLKLMQKVSDAIVAFFSQGLTKIGSTCFWPVTDVLDPVPNFYICLSHKLMILSDSNFRSLSQYVQMLNW